MAESGVLSLGADASENESSDDEPSGWSEGRGGGNGSSGMGKMGAGISLPFFLGRFLPFGPVSVPCPVPCPVSGSVSVSKKSN